MKKIVARSRANFLGFLAGFPPGFPVFSPGIPPRFPHFVNTICIILLKYYNQSSLGIWSRYRWAISIPTALLSVIPRERVFASPLTAQ